jgi:predicted ATPase
MSASNWVRGVVNNADKHRTQEPVDVRIPRTIEAQPQLDPEAAAIDAIVYALRPLNGEARSRVLQYIAARFPPHKFED